MCDYNRIRNYISNYKLISIRNDDIILRMERRTLLKTASLAGAIPMIGATSARTGSECDDKPDSFSEVPPKVRRRYKRRSEILHQQGPQTFKSHVEKAGGAIVASDGTFESNSIIRDGSSFGEVFQGIGMAMVVDCEDDRYVSVHAWSKLGPFSVGGSFFPSVPYCPDNPLINEISLSEDAFGMYWSETQYSGFSNSYNTSDNMCLSNTCGDYHTNGFAGVIDIHDSWIDFAKNNPNERSCDKFWGEGMDGMLWVEDPDDPPSTREVYCDYTHLYRDCSLNITVSYPWGVSVGGSCSTSVWDYQDSISEGTTGGC